MTVVRMASSNKWCAVCGGRLRRGKSVVKQWESETSSIYIQRKWLAYFTWSSSSLHWLCYWDLSPCCSLQDEKTWCTQRCVPTGIMISHNGNHGIPHRNEYIPHRTQNLTPPHWISSTLLRVPPNDNRSLSRLTQSFLTLPNPPNWTAHPSTVL